jgi:two-component system nitrogen regulation response regulator NtrX
MSVVLIVDDVKAMRDQYAYDLRRLGGHETITAADGEEALKLLQGEPIDCMILDLEMPGVDGFEVLRKLAERENRMPVIVYTGTGSFDRCVRAVKLGAYSFIDKAEPTERVIQEVENALKSTRLKRQVSELNRRIAGETPLIGESEPMVRLREQIARLAPIPSPVLIQGESGSGKELVAHELHERSDRSDGPFVARNCAAIARELMESELFGHERGAFTGAVGTRRGVFELASSGTLFLDEVGDLGIDLQPTLLRVLEENTIRRIGSEKQIRVDTRVIAATHRDLEREVGGGRFRRDLLYRLNVHLIQVPPLRERLTDIPLLVAHLSASICKRDGIPSKMISPDALAALARYSWAKNNVRELRNVLERMIYATDAEQIDERDVPLEIIYPGQDKEAASSAGAPRALKEMLEQAERQMIEAALIRNGRNKTETARELGLADHASLIKKVPFHRDSSRYIRSTDTVGRRS